MDTVKSNNERELTSTMGNVLSMSSKDEKNDTSDATPTSSTDANTTSTGSQILSDDPISSTSSDIVEQNKSKTVEVRNETASNEPDKSTVDHEADLLEMSISNVPNEKITEDVEDLVHDLESLLGESTDSFNVPVKRKSPEVKVVLDQPQTSTVPDKVLSSGDPISSKIDIKPKTLEVKSLEDKPEQQERSQNKTVHEIIEDTSSNVESNLNTKDDPSEIFIEPQSSNECQIVGEVKIQDVAADDQNATKEVIESVDVLEDLSTEKSNSDETSKEEPLENIDMENAEIVETIEKDTTLTEATIEQKVDVSEEDTRTKEVAPNSEDIVIGNEESKEDNNKQVQDIESETDLKEIIESKTETEENATKLVVEDKYEATEAAQLYEEVKPYDASVVKGGSSGDDNREEEKEIEKTDESQKDGSGDLKTENTESNKESLKDPDQHQELPDEHKEIVPENQSIEIIEKNQEVDNVIELKETSLSSTDDKRVEEPLNEESEQENPIVEPPILEEVECEEIKPNSVQFEVVSNTEAEDHPEDKIVTESVNEDCEVKAQEEIKEIESSKEEIEERLEQTDSVLSVSKDIPEQEEIKLDDRNAIPVPETPTVESSPETSETVGKEMPETSENVVIIEDEPEGIISEPEQVEETTAKVPEEDEVEIMEITDETEEIPDEEAFEGVVTDEFGQRVVEQNVEIATEVTEIPDIIVVPPDDIKEKADEEMDMVMVEPQSDTVAEQAIGDNEFEEPAETTQSILVEEINEVIEKDKCYDDVNEKLETHKDESLEPVNENVKADEETPKLLVEIPTPSVDTARSVEETVTAVDEITANQVDDALESIEETAIIAEETRKPEPEISIQISESVAPVDTTPSPSEEVSKAVDETIELVDDEPVQIIDDEPVQTIDDEPVQTIDDEPVQEIEEPGPSDIGKTIVEETSSGIDEASAPVDETQETAEAVAISNETATSCEVTPQPFEETPTSSDETLQINNEVSPSDIKEVVELEDETIKTVEAFEVVVAEENLEFVGDISQEEQVTSVVENIELIQTTMVPESSKETIEISDDDSKPADNGDGDYVQVLSSGGETDSEEMVPVLALEPDENNTSPKEPVAVKDDTEIEKPVEVMQPLEDPPSMEENLETEMAVASLNVDSTPVDEISEKERREMEALRKAVESITDNSAVELEEDIIRDSEITVEEMVVEEQLVESVIPDVVEEKIEVVIAEEEEIDDKTEHVESDTDQDVPELRIEDSEDTQDVEENIIASKSDLALPDTSENDRKKILPDSSQLHLVNDQSKQAETPKETKTKTNERPRRRKKSTGDNKLGELTINVDVPDREKPYSPKITIKPIRAPDDEVSTTSNSDSELSKGSLKMTITKQSDKMHSILKICEPETAQEPEEPIPKLIIKPKMQQVEQQHSPKMSTRSSKQIYSPTSSAQRSGSPRITIKPVVKAEAVSPLKIKIKPDDALKKHNAKVIIKPVCKPDEPEQVHSPRITIKPIPKPDSEKEMPRLNIKPIKKQDEEEIETERERSSPKIIIKPIKPPEPDTQSTNEEEEVKERIVLKINKGNLPTPTKDSKKREHPPDEDKSEKLAKITVKFSKGGGHPHIVHQSDESNKRSHEDPSTPEKTKKQKTEVESPMSTRSKHKENPGDDPSSELHSHDSSKGKHKDATVSPIEPKRVKMKEMLPESPVYESTRSRQKELSDTSVSRQDKEADADNADVRIIETKLDSPIVISEDSRSQDSGSCVIVEDVKDPLASIPVFEIRAESKAMTPKQELMSSVASTPSSTPSTPTPRKRGRPRKVPIVVREEFKEQEEPKSDLPQEEQKPAQESGRPKRSCRGQSARATLGIKPRKPRGPGRGRGGKRGMGTRPVPMKPEREPKLSKAKLKLLQESLKEEAAKATEKEHDNPMLHCLLSNIEIKAPAPPETAPIEVPVSPTASLPVPSPQAPVASPASAPAVSPKPAIQLSTGENDSAIGAGTSTRLSGEIVMVDEETRMSADTNSRAQTPAKQIPADIGIEESQSSVQSTATTESGKARPNKAPRLEVQEPEGAVISADQLTEYYWNGNGPYMLQEQVAQFLGIKSFKRKYPGIMRRMLDMQERDFIRESGLATEHMCDLGLTAVNSADILDIMYSDFQDKYEEYCKHQRDRQAKDLINKQRALSLAASQEKNKADITEQAVHSAAQWNATFNKSRREQRKACMDLQTLTVHYPKGKMKQISDTKVGDYPVALVPGQFTDYYKDFTATEINNLPINTMCYDPINIIPADESEDSGSEGSDSDSDSSSSSSGSGSDSSSGVEDCKLCKTSPKKVSPNK